jgi:hypothetical protein
MIAQKYLDELTYEVVGAAIEVHKIMGRRQKTDVNEYFKLLPKFN